jgi:hypothetical protein
MGQFFLFSGIDQFPSFFVYDFGRGKKSGADSE